MHHQSTDDIKTQAISLGMSLSVILLLGIMFGVSDVPSSRYSELGISELSPSGLSGGKFIPASCPSDLHDEPSYGQACTSANICGVSNPGSIQCGGLCNAIPPPLPDNYGKVCSTAYNACGLRNFGTLTCDGTCSAKFSPPESACATLNETTSGISIMAKPKLIPSGGKTTLTWTGAGDCLVYNPAGVAIATSTSGTLEVTGITKTTRYVLMCTDAIGKISNASVSVSPGVRFEEI
ncbi:MAG: hypothetical protein AAB355_00360, partial [Patescibacteria group bacterium]